MKQAAADIPEVDIVILPESESSYLGDSALISLLLENDPDVVGFSVFSWNIERCLYIAKRLKEKIPVRIIFGGPEVTRDNPRVRSGFVDFRVYGDGERIFCNLLKDPVLWNQGEGAQSSADIFEASGSPYLKGFLEPEIENLVLLETQRGCPYRCGFCFYNKSRTKPVFTKIEGLIDTISWAIEREIKEIYLLDPSLNARKGLDHLLREIIRINSPNRIHLFSEIRAEAVDSHLADLLKSSGFNWFEIGLQSSNPEALSLIKRSTDLTRFIRGTRALKERGIVPGIDLILGLPGDDLDGFMKSVDFVVDNDLKDDLQIFPLSVLPGTRFRSQSQKLGLKFEPTPPYTIINTRQFSSEDLLLAYDYAETRLDTSFFPLPDLDLSWRPANADRHREHSDIKIRIGRKKRILKISLFNKRPLDHIEALAGDLTHPYQLLIGSDISDHTYLRKVLTIVSETNPFTPFEIIFFEPKEIPDTRCLLDAIKLYRPHYLDGDLRFLFPHKGNRTVLFTLVSGNEKIEFQGEMERQVYWWRKEHLPDPKDLERFNHLDGLLIETDISLEEGVSWQVLHAKTLPDPNHLSFADIRLQKNWILTISPDEYTKPVVERIEA